MPDIAWNRQKWGDYQWPKRGHEWSVAWGRTSVEWIGMLLPRLFGLLPVRNLVEIAPGYGRWTKYLLEHCDRLDAFDLNVNCVEFCNKTFAEQVAAQRCSFTANDGLSLPGIADGSTDMVFSFDSLVHVEQDVIDAYLGEIERVLKPGGYAFLHHSNLATLGTYKEGTLGRGVTVGASTVAKAARARGLSVMVQEMMTWQGTELRDCITLLIKGTAPTEPVLIENFAFWPDAAQLKKTVAPYHVMLPDTD